MADITLILPKLYPKQDAFVNDPARYTVCFASTKSGKSVGMLSWILGRAWADGRDGRDFYWIAPSYSVAKIMFLRIVRWMSKADPERRWWTPNESELVLRVGKGSRIYFKGGDRPDMLYGPDAWGVVIDEGTRMKEEAWHAARSLVTKTEGAIKIVGNMRGRHNWMYTLWQRGIAGDPAIGSHKLDAYDAIAGGVLKPEEIEDAKRQLPENVFRELYLAEPSDDGGNPFGLAAIAACVVEGLSSHEPVVWGIDLGKAVDWTVLIALDAFGTVCRFVRVQQPWERTMDMIVSTVGRMPTLVDSTGLGDVVLESLQKRAGPYGRIEGFKFSRPSKQQLMEGLAVAIQHKAVRFPNAEIRLELDSFEYEQLPLGIRYTAPEGLHDDCVCALALAVEHLRTAARRAPMGPLRFGTFDG